MKPANPFDSSASLTADIDQSVRIPSGIIHLDGILHIPSDATGLVLFVHGSGSGRFSPRNQYVAKILNEAKLGTLLFDLLTPEEDQMDAQTKVLRFDIEFLASRLMNATAWCSTQRLLDALSIGYFGASTGGGAALVAAAMNASVVKAVVSRGGRPDLAGHALSQVEAPTLLIVGGNDKSVITMNQSALASLHCIKKLEIIPRATHLFEEPDTLEAVAQLAKAWFSHYVDLQ